MAFEVVHGRIDTQEIHEPVKRPRRQDAKDRQETDRWRQDEKSAIMLDGIGDLARDIALSQDR